jgi:hypothetical protein
MGSLAIVHLSGGSGLFRMYRATAVESALSPHQLQISRQRHHSNTANEVTTPISSA